MIEVPSFKVLSRRSSGYVRMGINSKGPSSTGSAAAAGNDNKENSESGAGNETPKSNMDPIEIGARLTVSKYVQKSKIITYISAKFVLSIYVVFWTFFLKSEIIL